MTSPDARRTAFAGLIDHAPLFPPAALAPPAAVAAHDAARSSPRAELCARLVWPAATLGELLDLLPAGVAPESPWALSALLATPDEAAALVPLAGGPLRVEQVEVRLLGDGDVARLGEALDAAGLAGLRPVFEVGLDGDWQSAIELIASVPPLDGGPPATAKVRTGGATPDAVPSPDRLAAFIGGCARAGVAFKATAGLHHPFWHPDPAGGFQHGFVAVLAGAAVAARGEADAVVAACLTDEPAAFGMTDEGLRWRDVWVDAGELAAVRERGFRGVGSCSFDEPVADLEELGWLS